MEKFYKIPLPTVDPSSKEILFQPPVFSRETVKALSKVLNLKNFPRLKALKNNRFKKSFAYPPLDAEDSKPGILFLSNQESMTDDFHLKTNRITNTIAVLKLRNKAEMMGELEKKMEKRLKENKIKERFDPNHHILKIQIDDLDTEDISRFFIVCIKYIEGVLKKRRSMVVFCNKGLSRSPTVIASYLIWKFGFSTEDAMAYLKHFRGLLKINKSFQMQLTEWEMFCKKRFKLSK